MYTPNRKVFNKFFDITDPAEFLGTNLPSFSIALNYPLDIEFREKFSEIQNGFFDNVINSIKEEKIGSTIPEYINYKDSKISDEHPRPYLKIEHSTARNTQITSLARCSFHGDNLYIAIDSYVLGSLKIFPLVMQFLFTFVSLWLLIFFPFFFLPICIYLYFAWIDVFRATKQKSDFVYGLRCKFNNSLDLGSFNTDDTLKFLKSLLPVVISSIRDTLRSNGISLEGIEDLLKNIEQKVSSQTISMQAGGNISLFGVNIASYDSQASSQ